MPAGAIAASAAHAASPQGRWGAVVALLWTALPLVLAARVCIAAQDPGWGLPWRAGVGTAALALAVGGGASTWWRSRGALRDGS